MQRDLLFWLVVLLIILLLVFVTSQLDLLFPTPSAQQLINGVP